MLPKLKYYLTNWVDGMKINRQHFIDSENALVDSIRDVHAASVTTYSYGLLTPLADVDIKDSLDCNILSSEGNSFKINVSYCRAVTSGGCRIEIIPGAHPELVSKNDIFNNIDNSSGGTYYAVISVDPFNRQPFGHANPSEQPSRNQSAISDYQLNLVPAHSVNPSSLGAYHMPVARFTVRNGSLTRDANYIPPCAVISAHAGSKQIYNIIAEQMNQIQEYSGEIVRKVVDQNQDTALAKNVRDICEHNIWHISSEFFKFRMMYRQQSPIQLATCVVQLANAVNIPLNMIHSKDKEELLQYFSYWNGMSPGKFEEMLSDVINADYTHENIYDFFQPLLSFLKVWSDLLEKLKDLKLIGSKKETFDFGGRTVDTPKDKGKGKFSIFD